MNVGSVKRTLITVGTVLLVAVLAATVLFAVRTAANVGATDASRPTDAAPANGEAVMMHNGNRGTTADGDSTDPPERSPSAATSPSTDMTTTGEPSPSPVTGRQASSDESRGVHLRSVDAGPLAGSLERWRPVHPPRDGARIDASTETGGRYGRATSTLNQRPVRLIPLAVDESPPPSSPDHIARAIVTGQGEVAASLVDGAFPSFVLERMVREIGTMGPVQRLYALDAEDDAVREYLVGLGEHTLLLRLFMDEGTSETVVDGEVVTGTNRSVLP